MKMVDDTNDIIHESYSGILVADFLDVENINLIIRKKTGTASKNSGFTFTASAKPGVLKNTNLSRVDEVLCFSRTGSAAHGIKIEAEISLGKEMRISGRTISAKIDSYNGKLVVRTTGKKFIINGFLYEQEFEDGELVVTIKTVAKPLRLQVTPEGDIRIGQSNI